MSDRGGYSESGFLRALGETVEVIRWAAEACPGVETGKEWADLADRCEAIARLEAEGRQS